MREDEVKFLCIIFQRRNETSQLLYVTKISGFIDDVVI